MGDLRFNSRSACSSWIGVGDEGPSNPDFPGPDGSILFIVSVPSCPSSARSPESRPPLPQGAPIARDSGQLRGKRAINGGRLAL